jgi:RNAse (barnase) inhibitor barstar
MTDGNAMSTLLSACADAGLYRLPEGAQATLQTSSENLGFSFSRVDLAACTDKDALLQRIAASLAFPDWFGHNWDALADCLADLSWLEGRGHVILLENVEDAHRAAQDQLETALQIFDEAAQRQRELGTALWVFVDMRPPGLAWLPTT